MRVRPYLVVVALAIAVVAACGSAQGGAGGASNELTVTMTEFKFQPASLSATAGRAITLHLKNAGTVEHDFKIEKTAVSITLKPGQTVTKEIPALAAGVYDVVCSVPGHKEAGMATKLTVR